MKSRHKLSKNCCIHDKNREIYKKVSNHIIYIRIVYLFILHSLTKCISRLPKVECAKLRVSRAFIPFLLTCLMCLHFLRVLCPHFLHALNALIFYVPSLFYVSYVPSSFYVPYVFSFFYVPYIKL